MRAKGKNRKSRLKHLAKIGGTTGETIINHQKQMARKKRQKMNVLINLATSLAKLAAVVLAVLLMSLLDCAPDDSTAVKSGKELDRINSYCVDVVPQNDGTLEITYDIVWQVLDGDSEGPLSWVNLGLANRDCDLIGYEGAVKSVDISGTHAYIYLDREYDTGETVQFSICVSQGHMLCRNEQDETKPFYEFIPGWFNGIKVDRYLFTWAYSDGIISQNSDERTDDKLIWSGSLDFGERRAMQVYYNIENFESPELVDYSPSSGSSGTMSTSKLDSCTDGQIIIAVVLIAFIVLICVIDSYNNGSGFSSGGYRYHHSRVGGRSCACAGCACACACAGGGRAGCSVKDFYSNQVDEEITVSKE